MSAAQGRPASRTRWPAGAVALLSTLWAPGRRPPRAPTAGVGKMTQLFEPDTAKGLLVV